MNRQTRPVGNAILAAKEPTLLDIVITDDAVQSPLATEGPGRK